MKIEALQTIGPGALPGRPGIGGRVFDVFVNESIVTLSPMTKEDAEEMVERLRRALRKGGG